MNDREEVLSVDYPRRLTVSASLSVLRGRTSVVAGMWC